MNFAPGIRISLRGEDFLVTDIEDNHNRSKILKVEGISELVRGKRFVFDTSIDKDIDVIDPANSKLVPDVSSGYSLTKLFLEAHIRNSTTTSNKILVGHKAAINAADYQMTPTLKSLDLPRPRLLIADAVGLGKTIEVGVFLAEQIKRGKGKRILVLAPKAVLTQFQQEIWHRFSIPLVRLDSIGIQRIKAELPSNKNPFDYYDKTIISIDTLKNNAKFRHYLEKTRWDIIAIDECHTVANISSLRGNLAQYLSTKCESLVLTSATPHNGSRESFANLIEMIEPIAIPRVGDYTKEHVLPYYVRRFKKDIGESVQENFREREVLRKEFNLSKEEEDFFEYQQTIKINALNRRKENGKSRDLLFSIGLFKSYLSSPEACLETITNRIKKIEESKNDDIESIETLDKLKFLVERVIENKADSKYKKLLSCLNELGWQGKNSDKRIIIFAERIKTLEKLYEKLKEKFNLSDESIIKFDGSLNDVQQQEIIDDFGKEDSKVKLFLSSDAGSQGVNLHFFCNTMFNYDIPWSIITLEQRNGRIDRYGQKHTPHIYYLVGKSDAENIKGDLHIIEKLSKKEDEIHRVLGDASSFLKKYDSEKEEQAVEDMLISGDSSKLDENLANFKWESIFGEVAESTETTIDNDPVQERKAFFKTDFDFYKYLVSHLVSINSVKQSNIQIEDNLIEVTNDKEIDSYLYDVPSEAKPKRGTNYKLTVDKDKVQDSIDKSRKKKGEWSEFQMLYDLHPIIKVYMNKLEASVDKDVALVVKTNKITQGTKWYVFHGQIANKLGQSVLSEFFVVGLKEDGSFLQLSTFEDFVKEFNLTDTLINEAINNEELIKIKNQISFAVDNSKEFYIDQKKEILKFLLKNKQTDYKEKLTDWYNSSKEQLQFQYEDITLTTITKAKKEKEELHIETILNDKSQYYEDITSLDNFPFIKLLAVFFN